MFFNDTSEAFRKYKIIVLSDEIYGQLNFSGHHVPLSKVSFIELYLIKHRFFHMLASLV